MARPRIGRLDQRLTLEERTLSRSASGEATSSWSTLDTVWGKIDPLEGREFFEARAKWPEASVRFVARFRDDFDVIDRVTWNGDAYDIHQVLEDEDRRFMEMIGSAHP